MTDWSDVVERHSPLVWRIAYRLLGNESDAADCTQETFLTALKFAEQKNVRDWGALLNRIATSRALDQLRRRKRDRQRTETTIDDTTMSNTNPNPLQIAVADEFADRLIDALTRIPPQNAEVFSLVCISGLSQQTVANQLQITHGNLRAILHRTRTQLREILLDSQTICESRR
ncbi:MAG: hypothetical protein CMJ49_08000 [Planctomycetaceae bacterium]|nr:hypothetical protein [Planctomycetaceae bacterium]